MSKHTPGPWTLSEISTYGYQDILCNEKYHSGVDGKYHNKTVARVFIKKSDARIIATAPDYDLMARHLEAWWRLPSLERTIEAIEPIIREALDAIAKVDGE